MVTSRPLPDPDRIQAYLTTHGWNEGWRLRTGVMFVFEERDDDGEEITVFVPNSTEYDDYPLRVRDVAETLAAIERRPQEAVLADMMATTPNPSTPATPAAPLNGHPAVSEGSVPGLPPN